MEQHNSMTSKAPGITSMGMGAWRPEPTHLLPDEDEGGGHNDGGEGGTQEGAEGTEGQEPKGTEGAEGTEGDDPDDGADKELTPAEYKAALKRVRAEAAGYRTRLRDAESKLSEAKTPEELEAALTEVKNQNAALELSVARSEVARKHGLPDDLAAALQGADKDALEAHAKVLAKYVPQADPEHLGGGLDPNEGEDGGDVRSAVQGALRRRY